MDPALLHSFILVTVTLIIAPGPDIFFLIVQSMAQGSRRGRFIALGLTSGLLFHSAVALTGLTLLLTQAPGLMSTIKYMGVFYLLYLAYKTWKTPILSIDEASVDESLPFSTDGAYYRRGVIMNILNPKVGLFFLALFPQFITPDGWPVSLQIATLAAVQILETLVIFGLVATLAGKLKRFFKDERALTVLKYFQILCLVLISGLIIWT